MRLVAGALALILFASFARAEDIKTDRSISPAISPAADVMHSKIPFRVIRIMAQSHQALLFDRARATHVLAEIGGKIDGYTVEAIDDDEVTLSFEGKQIVLAAPARAGNRRHDRDMPAVYGRSAADAQQTDMPAIGPITMASPAPAASPAPIDPYGETAIRVVEAPGAAEAKPAGQASRAIEAGEGGVRVAEAPGSPADSPGSFAQTPAPRAPALAPQPSETKPTGIRVVEAPAGVTRTRTSDTRIDDASAEQDGIRVTEAPAGVPGAPSAPPDIDARAVDAPTPGVKAPEVRASDAARAPDKQTIDARAMADVMSAGNRPHGPRTPASTPLPTPARTAAADPRPAITAQPASEIRTAFAAPADTVVLTRADVDGALADFAKLTAAVRGSFSASGLVVDAVSEGSIFQRAGLRAGDVVTAVDGARLRSLDDAANLYARAPSTKAITAQILRGGKPLALHVAIQ